MTLTILKNQFSPHATAQEMDIEHRRILAGLNPHFETIHKKSLIDTNEGWSLLRSLTVFSGGMYKKRFPDVKYATVYPVRTGAGGKVPPGAEMGLRQWGWYSAEDIGAFKTQANGVNDLPSLSLNTQEHLVDLKKAGASFHLAWDDIESAALRGQPIQSDLAGVSRAAGERYHDLIGASGDSVYNLHGLIADFADMSDYGAASGTDWIASNWSGATPLQRLDALAGLITFVPDSSGQIYSAGMLIMPGRYLNDIKKPNLIVDGMQTSVYNSLMSAYASNGLVIESWERLAAVDFSGTPYDVIMSYPVADEVGEHRIIVPYMLKAPMLEKDGDVYVAAYTLTAGVLKRQPKAHAFGKTNWT
jgi:hypothetical protein